MPFASNQGYRRDVRDKRPKEKVATDLLRQERRAKKELDEARAAVAELESRLDDAKTSAGTSQKQESGASSQLKALVQELADERRRVVRLENDHRELWKAWERAEALVQGARQARLEAQERRVEIRAALAHASSTLDQRKVILGELVELQKDELEARMVKKCPLEGSSLDALPRTGNQSPVLELLSLFESQPVEDGKLKSADGDAELGSHIFHFADSLRKAMEKGSRTSPPPSPPLESPLASPQSSDSAKPPPVASKREFVRDLKDDVEVQNAEQELNAAMRRVEELQGQLKKVTTKPRPTPPPPYSPQPRREIQAQLLKTTQSLHLSIKQLREEQVELLERLCIV